MVPMTSLWETGEMKSAKSPLYTTSLDIAQTWYKEETFYHEVAETLEQFPWRDDTCPHSQKQSNQIGWGSEQSAS